MSFWRVFHFGRKVFHFFVFKPILKGNLLELPFPAISEACDKALSALVDQVLTGDNDKERTIEDIIFSIYGFESEQMQHVRDAVDGKVN